MRIFLFIPILCLAACAKKSSTADVDAPTQPTYASYQAPSNCTQSAAGTFDFLEWDAEPALKYSCPVAAGQTCEMLLSADGVHAQLVCTGAGSRPASCVGVSGGIHDFISGTEEQASGYDCGVWNNLRCMRFEGATETEMRCLDNDLPYYGAFNFAN